MKHKSGSRKRGSFTEDQVAYIRYLAQERWDRIRDLWEEALEPDERAAALAELADFPERKCYQAIWVGN